MKISAKITDIHSLRKFVLYEVTGDHCLAEQFAHLCSFQPFEKRSNPAVRLRITHPPQESGITWPLRALVTRPATFLPHSRGLSHVDSTISPKRAPYSDFHLDPAVFKSTVLESVLRANGGHGVNSDLHMWNLNRDGQPQRTVKQRLVIDFSSPNVAKPFHAGHLRSTAIGNYIANIRSSLGDSVVRLNYFGDWGTQFGLVTAGYRLFGDSKQLETNAVQHLYEVYVRANRQLEADPDIGVKAEQACMELEQGKADVLDLWKNIRRHSIDNYSNIYKRLGVRFDVHEWESEQHVSAKQLFERLRDEGRLEESEGAQTFTVANGGKTQKLVLLKSNGSTLYLSRDVSAFLSRLEKYKFDKMLYVVEKSQSNHFANVGSLIDELELMPTSGVSASSLIEHVQFGRVSGMSTRKGTNVLLDDILNEAKYKMHLKLKQSETTKAADGELESVAEQLAISAVTIYDLKVSRGKGYVFNWEEVLNLKGDTGPFLQISHARLCSLFTNCGVDLNPEASLDSLVEPEAIHLITHLAGYDEAVRKSADLLESHILVRFLFALCHSTNSAFKKLTVKGRRKEVAEARLLMFHCARLTLTDGLKLLGVQPLHSI